jgi:hypothetical protein
MPRDLDGKARERGLHQRLNFLLVLPSHNLQVLQSPFQLLLLFLHPPQVIIHLYPEDGLQT